MKLSLIVVIVALLLYLIWHTLLNKKQQTPAVEVCENTTQPTPQSSQPKPSTPSKWTFWRAIRWMLFIFLLLSGLGFYTVYQYSNDSNFGIDFVDNYITYFLKKYEIGIYAPNYDALQYAAYPFCSQRWDSKKGRGVGKPMHEGPAVLFRKGGSLSFGVKDKSGIPFQITHFNNEFKDGKHIMKWNRPENHPNSPLCTSGEWEWSSEANLSPKVVKGRKLSGTYTCVYDNPTTVNDEGPIRYFWMDTRWNHFGMTHCSYESKK